MLIEIPRVTTLDAQKLAVDAGVVAIVSADDVAVANAESGFATV